MIHCYPAGDDLARYGELGRAIDCINRKVVVAHISEEWAEFLSRGWWVEIQRVPTGYRVRATKQTRELSRHAETVTEALEMARAMVMSG